MTQDSIISDCSAGFTVGVVLVAQGVAYGLLTGLPAYYGLYAGLLPSLIYAAFGTSRQMHIGPFALISMLVADGAHTAVHPRDFVTLFDPHPSCHEHMSNSTPAQIIKGESADNLFCLAYIDACMTMSMMVGAMFLFMWVFKLGFVVEFMSDSMIRGMTTAAAVLICTSQMKHVLGITIDRGSFANTWETIFKESDQINYVAVAIAVSSLVIQLVIERMNKKHKWKVPIPSQLVVVVLMTAVVAIGGLGVSETHTDGVTILGDVPSGLPSPYFPNLKYAKDLVQGALIVGVVSLSLCTATVKTFADKNNYEIVPEQELFALGLANLLGGMWRCYPPSSSLSRSALADSIGSKTPAWNLVSCSVIVLVRAFCQSYRRVRGASSCVLLFVCCFFFSFQQILPPFSHGSRSQVLMLLTSALRQLPNACLATIIFMAFVKLLKQVRPSLPRKV